MQVKLLRVLQERCVQRLGGQGREIPVDVRLVAATHHDLHQLVEQGRFRADLMYRLNVIPVRLPPLRERREDLPELVRVFTSRLNQSHQRNVVVGADALAALARTTGRATSASSPTCWSACAAVVRWADPAVVARALADEASPGEPVNGLRRRLRCRCADHRHCSARLRQVRPEDHAHRAGPARGPAATARAARGLA
jgi:sigma54-dependent transcription regulator